ncbi:hypothetical protein SAMN05518849_12312 [Sphingobium sp. AP50]|nr:hypothetical protein SAMN05518849_12312 [Sphingobium sp. AP50]
MTLAGAQAGLYGIVLRLYRTGAEATAMGAAVASGRSGSIAGPLLAGALVAAQL